MLEYIKIILNYKANLLLNNINISLMIKTYLPEGWLHKFHTEALVSVAATIVSNRHLTFHSLNLQPIYELLRLESYVKYESLDLKDNCWKFQLFSIWSMSNPFVLKNGLFHNESENLKSVQHLTLVKMKSEITHHAGFAKNWKNLKL